MATVTPEQAYQIAYGHFQAGRLADAQAICRQVLAVQSRDADALHLLGVIALHEGRLDAAVDRITEAIAIRPGFAAAHGNLGNALLGGAQWERAIAAYREAITLRPGYAEVHNNLGNALRAMGRMDEAVTAYRQAVALRPGFAEAYSNLGLALKDQGRVEEAIAAWRHAIALKPDFAEAHSDLGNALLVHGDFAQGWEEYEWRWKSKDAACLRRDFSEPLWDGSHLEGRTVLLHAEQGFGDTVQFVRYLPLVRERGGKIIVECQQELQRLLQANMPELTIVARGGTLPAFDVHCPFLSLPRIFATDLTNIPCHAPYLSADVAEAGAWSERLAGDSSFAKVGLVWAGNPHHRNDRERSVSLSAFAPLAGVHGVRFFSLQKGDAASEANSPPAGMELTCLGEKLKEFADTAALIANLDLVIAVDTAVVHLAGAMAKPVWTLLPFAPDWRWLLGREDSPWYPTMRLFRQPAIGDWDSVIRRVAEELRALRFERKADEESSRGRGYFSSGGTEP